MYQNTYHRDGTVTYWNVYTQTWCRDDAGEIHDDILASMNDRERTRILRMAGKDPVENVRNALRERYGKGKYRITGHIGINEEVHVYSQMPNSIETGWWLMGDLTDAELRLGIKTQ